MSRKRVTILIGISEALAWCGLAIFLIWPTSYLINRRTIEVIEFIGQETIFIIMVISGAIFIAGITILFKAVNYHYNILNKNFSKRLYFWPIFLGQIGGQIAYRKLIDKNQEAAEALKYLGEVISSSELIIGFIVFFMFLIFYKIVFMDPITEEIFEKIQNMI